MKTIPDYMDLSLEQIQPNDQPCVACLHKVIQDAQTATTYAEVRHSREWLQTIQGQCCRLIHTLSVDEGIHRDTKGENQLELVEGSYNDLITFISGVGVTCDRVIERLDMFDFTDMAKQQMLAGKS